MKTVFGKTKEFLMLQDAIIKNKFNSNLLILSKDEETAMQFAKEVAFAVFCSSHSICGSCEGCIKTEKETNPDLLIYPKQKSFQVDDANSIVETSLLKPMIFGKKIYLILNIDNSTPAAQNKILKILEEPPQNVLFLLTASNETKILPTIKSRCAHILVKNLDKNTLQDFFDAKSESRFNLAYEFGEGFIGATRFALEHPNFEELNAMADSVIFNLKSSKEVALFSSRICKNKQQFEIILKLLLLKFSKMINSGNIEYSDLCLVEIIEVITLAKQQIESNVNINIIADNLLMKILELKYKHRG